MNTITTLAFLTLSVTPIAILALIIRRRRIQQSRLNTQHFGPVLGPIRGPRLRLNNIGKLPSPLIRD